MLHAHARERVAGRHLQRVLPAERVAVGVAGGNANDVAGGGVVAVRVDLAEPPYAAPGRAVVEREVLGDHERVAVAHAEHRGAEAAPGFAAAGLDHAPRARRAFEVGDRVERRRGAVELRRAQAGAAGEDRHRHRDGDQGDGQVENQGDGQGNAHGNLGSDE